MFAINYCWLIVFLISSPVYIMHNGDKREQKYAQVINNILIDTLKNHLISINRGLFLQKNRVYAICSYGNALFSACYTYFKQTIFALFFHEKNHNTFVWILEY